MQCCAGNWSLCGSPYKLLTLSSQTGFPDTLLPGMLRESGSIAKASEHSSRTPDGIAACRAKEIEAACQEETCIISVAAAVCLYSKQQCCGKHDRQLYKERQQ